MRDDSREHESLVGDLRGRAVFTADGEQLGNVEDLLYSRLSEVPEWLIVPSNLEGEVRRLVVPVAGFELRDAALIVPYTASQIAGQPRFEFGEGLDADSEIALNGHFGLGSTS